MIYMVLDCHRGRDSSIIYIVGDSHRVRDSGILYIVGDFHRVRDSYSHGAQDACVLCIVAEKYPICVS